MSDEVSGPESHLGIWVPRQNIAIVYSEEIHRITILSLSSDQPVVLSGIAEQIWHLVVENHTTQEICAILRKIYEIDGEKIRDTINRFLFELESLNLVKQITLI